MDFMVFERTIEQSRKIDTIIDNNVSKLTNILRLVCDVADDDIMSVLSTASLQGSGKDGGFSARNLVNLDVMNFTEEFEMDLSFRLGCIPQSLSHFVKEDTQHPGFMILEYQPEFKDCLHKFFRDKITSRCVKRPVNKWMYGPGSNLEYKEYFNAREVFLSCFGRYSIFDDNNRRNNSPPDSPGLNKMDSSVVETLTKLIFSTSGKEFHEVKARDLNRSEVLDEEVARTINIDIERRDGNKRIVLDLVPMMKLEFWPDIAKTWLIYEKWPSFTERKAIVEKYNCGLVTKHENKRGCFPSIQWRLSFSDIESHMMSLIFSDLQYGMKCYLCYFLFKSIFYRYLKPLKCECKSNAEQNGTEKISHIISTYLVKTTFLHFTETHPPHSDSWDQPLQMLTLLLSNLHHSLKSRNLPHYIMSSVNVLSNFTGYPDCPAIQQVCGIMEKENLLHADGLVSILTDMARDFDLILGRVYNSCSQINTVLMPLFDSVKSMLDLSSTSFKSMVMDKEYFLQELKSQFEATNGVKMSQYMKGMFLVLHNNLIAQYNFAYYGKTRELQRKTEKAQRAANEGERHTRLEKFCQQPMTIVDHNKAVVSKFSNEEHKNFNFVNKEVLEMDYYNYLDQDKHDNHAKSADERRNIEDVKFLSEVNNLSTKLERERCSETLQKIKILHPVEKLDRAVYRKQELKKRLVLLKAYQMHKEPKQVVYYEDTSELLRYTEGQRREKFFINKEELYRSYYNHYWYDEESGEMHLELEQWEREHVECLEQFRSTMAEIDKYKKRLQQNSKFMHN